MDPLLQFTHTTVSMLHSCRVRIAHWQWHFKLKLKLTINMR